MTKLTLANQIFAFLQSTGVDRVFLVPGGGTMFLVEAAATQDFTQAMTLPAWRATPTIQWLWWSMPA